MIKLKGQPLKLPVPEVVVLPRGNDKIVFTLGPVLDYTDFDKLMPRPQPKVRMHAGGRTEMITDSDEFRKEWSDYSEKRMAYMAVVSLSATPDLTWERVNILNPETWAEWRTELAESGLTEGEINYIQIKIFEANSLTETRLDEARKNFLASDQAAPSA